MEVIDSVKDYADLMREIFDFGAIKQLLSGATRGGKPFRPLLDAMHGGTFCFSFYQTSYLAF